MFKELAPILDQTPLHLALSKKGNQIVVSVIPLKKDGNPYPAANILGTVDDLDESFAAHLEKLKESLAKLKQESTIDTTELDKAIAQEKEEEKKAAEKKVVSKSKTPSKTTPAKASPAPKQEPAPEPELNDELVMESLADNLKPIFKNVIANREKKVYSLAIQNVDKLIKAVALKNLKAYFADMKGSMQKAQQDAAQLQFDEPPAPEQGKIRPNPAAAIEANSKAADPIEEQEELVDKTAEETFDEESDSVTEEVLEDNLTESGDDEQEEDIFS